MSTVPPGKIFQISVGYARWRVFPGGAVVKNLSAKAGGTGDAGSTPGREVERSPGVENGTPLQYTCLKNSMDRGAW